MDISVDIHVHGKPGSLPLKWVTAESLTISVYYQRQDQLSLPFLPEW